jgi:hypothetical protein
MESEPIHRLGDEPDLDDGTDPVEPDEVEVEEEDEATQLAKLRAQREEFAEDKTKDIDLPGYNGQIVIRYRRLDYEEIERIAKRVRKMREKRHPKASLYGQVDTLALACSDVLLRKDGVLEPMHHGFPALLGDGPTRWDGLARVVLPDDAKQPETAREAVLAVIPNPLAITPHHNELAIWMEAHRNEEDEDFDDSI